MPRRSTLTILRARGFDRCTRRGPHIHVHCSQCEALVINGVACHERGCPNEPRDTDEEEADD